MRLVGAATVALTVLGCAGPAARTNAPLPTARARPRVFARADGALVCEAEDFAVRRGWRAMPWGTNYFASTFADTFLSRKAYLSAEPGATDAMAVTDVEVGRDGDYAVLARYELPYRYGAQFRVVIRQHGAVVFDHRYGTPDGVKIWPFNHHRARSVQWPWGSSENIVWEGDDAIAHLAEGRATITLRAEAQDEPAARRNVDVLVLTPDRADVADRIAHENYLPLDGLLTQEGDVFARVHAEPDSAPVTVTVPGGIEHSPYWIHTRHWHAATLTAAPGETSGWVEVGALLDSLNDGQWNPTARATGDAGTSLHYRLEFGDRRGGDAFVTPIARFESREAVLRLVYDADTRRTHRVRRATDVLHDVVESLRAERVEGEPPHHVPVFAMVPDPVPGDAEWTALRDEFIRLTGVTTIEAGPAQTPLHGPAQYLDLRGRTVAQLEAVGRDLTARGEAAGLAVVSLGDEIPLEAAHDDAAFAAFLAQHSDAPRGLSYSPDFASAHQHPAAYLWSQRFAHAHAIAALAAQTRAVQTFAPQAGIGANYSPHAAPHYLGSTAQWISVFEQGGLTMPWSEDYIWCVPVGTAQMNFLPVDELRAGLRGHDGARLMYYAMPHSPGNTPADWRRMFYGDLAHGVNVFDLFELRPTQLAYTENYVDGADMYRAVRRGVYELGRFDDLVAHAHVRAGEAALWFGETGDAWHDSDAPFAAGKRTLYIAARHAGLAVDVVDEDAAIARGALDGYRVLYLTDAHVSAAATAAIARWVEAGGRLFATAGAGLRDELDRPDAAMEALLGLHAVDLDTPSDGRVVFEKQDLPWVPQLDTVQGRDAGSHGLAVFGARERVTVTTGEVTARFGDGSAAIVRHAVGRGETISVGFLPGLSYFRPALPRRPVDRASTDDGYDHFIPSAFDTTSLALIASLAHDVPRAVTTSAPRIDTRLLEAPEGTVIPLVDFGPDRVRGLRVTVVVPVPTAHVSLASGGAVRVEHVGTATVFTLDLDVADAIVARP